MKCPFCDNEDTSVVETRLTDNFNSIRRRRQCAKCNKRFTTYERIELEEIKIIKKNMSKERFSTEKLKKGMLKALEKRPVTNTQLENSLENIVKKIRKMEVTEIASKEIGKLVMKELKKLDKVAYVRFASVYKEFTDLEEFEAEIKKITKQKLKINIKEKSKEV